MTCIIGIKCKDGVVVGADQRIRYGDSLLEGEKITTFDKFPAFLASTGVDQAEFRPRFEREMAVRRIMNIEEVRKVMEVVRGEEKAEINGIIGGLEMITSGEAKLYRLHYWYAFEITWYETIGTAFQFPEPFLHVLCSPWRTTTDKAAHLISALIRLVQELETSLETLPANIVILRNNEGKPYVVEEPIINGYNRLERLKKKLQSFYSTL